MNDLSTAQRDDAAVAPDAVEDEPKTVREALRDFATTDPRTLGLFRILFGVFLLVDLYRRIPDLVFFYTNDGMLPNHAAIYRPMSSWLFSIYHACSTRGEVIVAFTLTAIVYVLYTIGWKTKVWQWVVLLLVTSLHSRNIMLENGGDVVANLLSLWTAFLPLGRRFSLDAMLESLRMRKENDATELNDRSSPQPSRAPVTSLAYAAIVANLAVIYFFNVVHKDGPAWRQAVSVHYVLWADRLVQPLGVWLRGWVPMSLIHAMTIGTLVIESSITVLVVSPFLLRSCRRVAAMLIIALHCGFQTVGHFGLFSFVMMLHAPLLLGPGDWEALARRMKAKLPARVVFYDAACGICHQLCRIAKRLDHLGKLTFVPNTEPLPEGVTEDTVKSTVVVTDATRTKVWTENDAVTQGLRALPYGVVLAKLFELPGLSSLAASAYRFVASRREAWSEALGYAACGVPQRFGAATSYVPTWERPPLFGNLGKLVSNGVLVLLVIALGSQVLNENRAVPDTINPSKLKVIGKLLPSIEIPVKKAVTPQPAWMAAVAQYPRFFQGWSMFAPVPPMDDGKVVVDAVTVDGRHIDPLAGGGPVDFHLPDERHGMLMTQFWYEFHDRIRRDANARYRDYFRDWLTKWHTLENRPARDKIVSFEAYWVWRTTQPPGSRRREETRRDRFMDWKAAETSPSPQTPLPVPPAPRGLPFLAPAASSHAPPRLSTPPLPAP